MSARTRILLAGLLAACHVVPAPRVGALQAETNPAPSPCPGCSMMESQADNAELFAVGRLVRILAVTPSPVQANTPTKVTVTARVDVYSTLLPSTVSLYELEPGTEQPLLRASMVDDGTDGDALKGDNVFTAVLSVNRPPAVVLLRAAASYSHLPEPAFSDVVRLLVQEASTPDQTLASAATLIEQNDMEGALAYFAASEARADALRRLNAQQRAGLVSFFRSLAFLKEHGEVRVYRGQWVTTGGETTHIEVGLTRNELGRWVIFTW